MNSTPMELMVERLHTLRQVNHKVESILTM